MPRVARWSLLGIAATAFLVALGYAAVYLASEWRLRSFAMPPAFAHPVATDAAAVARGAHLVRTRGCRGCHGPELQGQFMWEYAAAPSLSGFVQDHDVARFEAAIRHGIAHDGRAMYSMPAFSFVR
jgi:hypothetical protein